MLRFVVLRDLEVLGVLEDDGIEASALSAGDECEL